MRPKHQIKVKIITAMYFTILDEQLLRHPVWAWTATAVGSECCSHAQSVM